jgi:Helicase associated domain
VSGLIKARQAHDGELGEELDGLRCQLGRSGGRPRLPGTVHFDLPATVGIDFACAFDMCLVEATNRHWEFWFGMLEQFVERYGHARVLRSYAVNGYQLGKWINEQSINHTGGILDADCQRRLEGLPGWTWDPMPTCGTCGRKVSTDSCGTPNATMTPVYRCPTQSMPTGSAHKDEKTP